MGGIRLRLVIIGVAVVLALQGCTFTQQHPDPEEKHAALDRWNRCLQRFESDAAHFCDGHRRDVLVTYPAHLETQVDSMLRKQISVSKPQTMLKTGLPNVLDASETPDEETLP
ncbi:MAG: hypothetical protein AB8B64_07810 [Granulosicoccus sp.]